MTRRLEAGRLVIASHNEGKVREIAALLGPYGIEPVSAASLDLPEPEETGTNFIDNADLKALGERQITLDCDVVQADGGTRTAAITGAWVALRQATTYLRTEGVIAKDPLLDHVAAISCGVHNGAPVLDLDYEEDSNAEADANFVLTGSGTIVEIQATGEKRGFSQDEFEALFSLARGGIADLVAMQKAAG